MFVKTSGLVVAACGLLLLSSGPVAAADCKVTGRITLGGKPVPTGRIIFHLNDGQFVGAKVQKDGTYIVERVPTGTRKVSVEGNGIPAKYSSEDTSGLVVDLKKGDFTFDIALR